MRAIRPTLALQMLPCIGPMAFADSAATVVHDPGQALPTDAELERAGARIGRISIENDAIFDENDPREDAVLYRAVNRLHVTTRESTIRAQLLFASGDRYSRRVLDESERALRSQRYLREPAIQPVAWHDGVPAMGFTCDDHFQPGSNSPRPTAPRYRRKSKTRRWCASCRRC